MTTEYTPSNEIADEQFEEIPLCREPSSIRDLQYLYGYLNQLGQDTTDWPVDKEYIPYLTPEEVDELVGGHRNLVFLDFKIDPDQKTVRLLGATIESLDQWFLNRLAYSYYYPGKSVDHSITLKTGDNSPKQVAHYHTPRIIESWPQQEGVQKALEEHEERWIVDGIADVAGTAKLEETQNTIQRKLRNRVVGEDHSTVDTQRHLISVRFTQASTREYAQTLSREEWSYPAEVDVLLDSMASRRKNKWATKNKSNSEGRGACYVLGGEDRTLYGMASDPLYLYTGNRKSWMPRFNRDESSSIHPISGEAAKYIEHSQPLMEAASRTVNGGRLYQLPLITGEQTPDVLRSLYKILHEAKKQARESTDEEYSNTIDTFYQTLKNDPEIGNGVAKNLKFWTLFIVSEKAALKHAMAECRGTSILHHVNVADAATETATEMRNSGQFYLVDEMEFADPDANHLERVSTLQYFLNTTSNESAEEGNIDANSPALTYYANLFNGEQISLSSLIKEYAREIGNEYDPDGEYPLPDWLILEQFAQLQTLDRAGLLNIDLDTEETDTNNRLYNQTTKPTMSSDTESKAQTIAKAESDAFNRFINDHQLLADNEERRASFTLGALITTIARYQKSNGKNPITDRVNPKGITKYNFQSRTTDMLELVNTYSSVEGKVMRYSTLTKQLCDDLSHRTPNNWSLKNEDIQYHVALGMAFGAQYHGPDIEEPSDDDPTSE